MVNYFPTFNSNFSKKLYYNKVYLIYRWVFKYLKKIKKEDQKALEVGFGPGVFADLVLDAHPNYEYHGLDYDEKAVEYAQKINSKLKLVVGDACKLPYEDESFDLVFCWHVVEHLEKPELFFEETKRVLKKGGSMFIATPNLECFSHKVAGENWIGFKDPTHISLKTDEGWSQLVKDAGLTIVREGTSGIRGIKLVRKSPLYLLNIIPIYFFGFFNWKAGDAYCCIGRKY